MGDRKRPAEKSVALSEEAASALIAFTEASTARERLTALRRLFTARQMAAVRQRDEYDRSIAWCAARAGDTSLADDERLHALAVLIVVRSGRAGDEARLTKDIEAALVAELPRLELLDDTEDQARVLAAVREAKPAWAVGYALPRVVNDAPRSNVRRESIAIVLSSGRLFEDAVSSLADELERRGEKLPPPTFARLLLAVLTDLDAVLTDVSPSPGDHPSAGLVRLAELSRAHELRTLNHADQSNITEAFARLVRRVAATRLRTALDAATYEPLVVVRGAIGASWAGLVARAEALVLVRTDVTEALYVHARAGVPDAHLRRVLAALHGDDASFERTLAALAKEPGVPETVARWLTGAREVSADVVASVERANAEAEREQVASAFIAASTLDDWRFEHASATEVPWPLAEALVHHVVAFGERRHLSIGGRPGDVVRYDPIRHEVASVPPEGLSLVRLLTPLILETRHEGTALVVRKAIAEPFRREST